MTAATPALAGTTPVLATTPTFAAACAPDWQPLVDTFFASQKGIELAAFLQAKQDKGCTIYPPQSQWLRALQTTPLEKVRVVILGQDPYHGLDHKSGLVQAEGLAFSVAPGVAPPPSLQNIYKEIHRDLGKPIPTTGSLLHWAQNGYLLLNTCLTVDAGEPASHAGRGWEVLTDSVVDAVAARAQPAVFMLWGAHAKTKRALIDAHNADGRHLVLCANHPSPLSALRPPVPFIGCGHFGQARNWLARATISS